MVTCRFLSIITVLLFSGVADANHAIIKSTFNTTVKQHSVTGKIVYCGPKLEDPSVVVPLTCKKAIVAFHGLGDCAHFGYAQPFLNLSDVAMYIPDMPYSTKYLKESKGVISMGGAADLQAAFTILQGLCLDGYDQIALYGFSCGGGIVINLLYALDNPERFKKLFADLGINPSLIKSKIKGCIIDRPFSSYKYIAKATAGGFIGTVAGVAGYKRIARMVLAGNYTNNTVDLEGIEPLEAAFHIRRTVPLFIHGATKDAVVGFRGVVKIKDALLQKNRHDQITFAQSECGHVDSISPQLNDRWCHFLQNVLV